VHYDGSYKKSFPLLFSFFFYLGYYITTRRHNPEDHDLNFFKTFGSGKQEMGTKFGRRKLFKAATWKTNRWAAS